MVKTKNLIFLAMISLLSSCGNKEVSYDEVVYDKDKDLILYEGKPFNGKVTGGTNYPNEYAIIEDGKAVDVVKTTEKSNGYKEVRHKDNSYEYYDYNGNRITKSEYESNN